MPLKQSNYTKVKFFSIEKIYLQNPIEQVNNLKQIYLTNIGPQQVLSLRMELGEMVIKSWFYTL